MTTVIVDPEAEIAAILRTPIRNMLEQKAIEVESTVKRLMAASGGGRLYTTRFFRKHGKLYAYGSRVPHRASAPGQAPSVDTGRLIGSIHHVIGEDGEGQYAKVGTDYAVGLYQELGTRYQAPRPSFRPALYAVVG